MVREAFDCQFGTSDADLGHLLLEAPRFALICQVDADFFVYRFSANEFVRRWQV